MVSNHPLRFLLILILATLACGFPTASDSITPVPPADTVSPPTAIPALTIEQINNVQYPLLVPDDGRVVQMANGTYQSGTDTLSVDYAYIAATQFFALGDITGDGVGDAAVMFLENYGGTGNFGVLAIYANVAGEPVFLDSLLIDDRPMPNSISLINGEIFLDVVVHGFEDGGCCPTLQTTQTYALVKNQLRLVNYTTVAPNGIKREIVVTSPVDNTELSSRTFQLTGSVSIAPFENNLSFFVYDEDGNQYMAGPINVTAPDFGAPGTFDTTMVLDTLSAGTYYIEIQDQSAADGAILALESVKVILR
ncbi:MAG TPA: Gmad2 immunoglobulin-like domain-containing protein [Anaerolineales bacterium]|nr:Gmad2 immunoglobulin-like domain-containing protein [Anaerolineales bacterium]